MENGTQRWEKDGNRDLDVWRLPDGTLHRTDGPAFRRFLNDNCESEIWAQNGEYFREDGGPTGISHTHFYDWHKPKPSDVVRTEIWAAGPVGERPYVGNPRVPKHRADGPAVISHFRGGGIRSEAWHVDGQLHRDDGPAATEWNVDGGVVATAWFRHGEQIASPDGPTAHEFYADGTTRRQLWLTDGKLDNPNGPAYLEWFPDGSPKSVEYWVDGLMSRVDGPAAVEHSPDKGVLCEQWRIGDRLHRSDGPAVVFFHPNGNPTEHQWWIDGSRRSTGGPAIDQFDEAGQLTQAYEWTMPDALSAPYIRTRGLPWSSEPDSEFSWQLKEAEAGRTLRLWHRWMLGLDGAPDDAPFTSSDWTGLASEDEVASRLAYFPEADRIAQRLLEWRTWSHPAMPTDAAVVKETALAYVRYLHDSNDADFIRTLTAGALAGDYIVSDVAPEPEEGEYRAWQLNDATDEMSVPWLLHETLYNASGNNFLPIYWILEPLHGVDVSAWKDFHQANLGIVVGPSRIVVGPWR